MPTCRETEEINAAILMTIDCASFFVGFSANEQRHEKRCQKTVSLFKIRGVPRVCHLRRPYHVPHTKIARNVALVSKRTNGVGSVGGACPVRARNAPAQWSSSGVRMLRGVKGGGGLKQRQHIPSHIPFARRLCVPDFFAPLKGQRRDLP